MGLGKGPLGAKVIHSNSTSFNAVPAAGPSTQVQSPRASMGMGMGGMMQPLQPTNTGSSLSSASAFATGGAGMTSGGGMGSAKPNYNLSLADVAATPNGPARPGFNAGIGTGMSAPQSGPNYDLGGTFTNSNGNGMGNGMSLAMSSPPLSAPPPPPMGMSMNTLLTPSKPAQPAWGGGAGPGTTGQLSKSDWGDFDPLA